MTGQTVAKPPDIMIPLLIRYRILRRKMAGSGGKRRRTDLHGRAGGIDDRQATWAVVRQYRARPIPAITESTGVLAIRAVSPNGQQVRRKPRVQSVGQSRMRRRHGY